MAKPNPMANRSPWYKNTAPTYAGIFLWFVFWSGYGANVLGAGIGAALVGLVLAAIICHTLFYLVPGILGMKTGLPLYIVGTSTYGTQGGFLMPGFLMGVLQFGWLGVNAYFSALAINASCGGTEVGWRIIAIAWAALAAFAGLKGIKYVAKVATYLPLIPLVILLILFIKSAGGLGQFEPSKALAQFEPGKAPASFLAVLGVIITLVVGFFATAGAAGVDFGMNNKDAADVQMGGLVGIAGAIIFTAGLSVLIAAGAAGKGIIGGKTADVDFMSNLLGSGAIGKLLGLLLAISAFPSACFSSLIAANCFKTTLPKVNPFVSVGVGTVVSIILAVTRAAGKLQDVFGLIGASFGPICGAMLVDFLLSGKKWAGPRAGWNLAGWISWAVGFVVGILPNSLMGRLQVPFQLGPVYAFIVGAVVYFLLAKAGMEPPVVPIETAETAAAK
jgi:cytosine permease